MKSKCALSSDLDFITTYVQYQQVNKQWEKLKIFACTSCWWQRVYSYSAIDFKNSKGVVRVQNEVGMSEIQISSFLVLRIQAASYWVYVAKKVEAQKVFLQWWIQQLRMVKISPFFSDQQVYTNTHSPKIMHEKSWIVMGRLWEKTSQKKKKPQILILIRVVYAFAFRQWNR